MSKGTARFAAYMAVGLVAYVQCEGVLEVLTSLAEGNTLGDTAILVAIVFTRVATGAFLVWGTIMCANGNK